VLSYLIIFKDSSDKLFEQHVRKRTFD